MLPKLVSRTTDSGAGMVCRLKVQDAQTGRTQRQLKLICPENLKLYSRHSEALAMTCRRMNKYDILSLSLVQGH